MQPTTDLNYTIIICVCVRVCVCVCVCVCVLNGYVAYFNLRTKYLNKGVGNDFGNSGLNSI